MSNSQNRDFVLGVFFIIALVLVGCTSHAPSASRFMAAKPNSISYGFGGGGVLGDDNSHREEDDGKVYNYSELRFLLEWATFFRNDNFVFGFGVGEHSLVRLTLGFANDYLGVQGWISPIVLGEKPPANWKLPAGLMLIEQYPFNPDFRVGVSQFFAYNSYSGCEEGNGSLNFSSYVKFYREWGVGAYISYSHYSLEFRYGNELASDNQRFYIEFSMMQ